jgi:hypothetical protein
VTRSLRTVALVVVVVTAGLAGPAATLAAADETPTPSPSDDCFDFRTYVSNVTAVGLGTYADRRLAPGACDVFAVRLYGGELFTVNTSVADPEEGNLDVGVFRPDGARYRTPDSRVDDGRMAFEIREHGVHYVVVSGGETTVGPYTATLATGAVTDVYESNDRFATATSLAETGLGDSIYTGDVAVAPRDRDVFAFEAASGERIDAEVDAYNGTVDVTVHGPDRTRLAGVESVSDGDLTAPTTQTGTHYLVVDGATSRTVPYSFAVDAAPANDRFEPNDDAYSAIPIRPGTYRDLRIVEGETDVYEFSLRENQTLTAAVTYDRPQDDGSDANGGVDDPPIGLSVDGPELDAPINGTVTADGERVSVTAPREGTYYVRLHERGTLSYDLNVSTSGGPTPEVDRTNVTVSLAPSNATVAPNGTRTVAVRVAGIDEGIGAGNFEVVVSDPSVARFTDATLPGGTGLDSTSVENDSVGFAYLNLDTPDEGTVTAGRVTVAAGADTGRTTLSIRRPPFDTLIGEDDESYHIAAVENATLRVTESGGDRLRTSDPDDDGLHEDLDGDGAVTVRDVAVFLETYDESPITSEPARFDFNGDGQIDIVDVATLLETV